MSGAPAPAWRTVARCDLVEQLVSWLDSRDGLVRVAVDGAACLHPEALAESLVEPLARRGRRAHHVTAASFWRDASLRLEHGHEDADAYLGWLDAGALRREVLDRALDEHAYLPTLRDPTTNRSTRDTPRPLDDDAVLLVSGEFLLGLGLPFDRTVHLTAPAAALERDTDPAWRWTLPAHATYARTVTPDELADVVVRTDRRHPVVRGLPGG